MNKTWFVTEAYYPEERATGYILTQIAEGLASSRSVGVITGPATKEEEVVEAPDHETHNNVDIHRGPGTDFPKDSLLGKGINWLTRTFPMVSRAVSLVDASDTIIVVTNPPILPYLALLVKHLTGCTLVLLIHDVYPEVLSATDVLPKDSYIVRWWHRASAVLYRQVDRIVTLGRDMTRLVENKLDETDGRCGGRSKVVRIPNWSENDIIEPQARADNTVLQAHNLQDQFVVLYAGNHGRTHGIEHLAEAARRLDAAGEAVHFLFVGFGAKKDWLESYVASQGLSNVTSIRGISRSEQGDYLNACDLAVISFIPGMAGISVPSRTYNHMAAGKPILAAADESSELAEVVLEEKIGWRIAPGSPGDVADAVRYAASHPEECRTKGRRAARAAQTTYSFENVLSKYERLLATT